MTPLPETDFNKHFPFSLRTLLFLLACAAVFVAARGLFVCNHTDGLSTTVARAKLVALMFAAVGALYGCLNPMSSSKRHRALILRGGIAGGAVGFLVATSFGIEIAERVRTQYPEYWIWTRDWIDFLWIIAQVTMFCIVVSVATASLYCCCAILVRKIRRREQRL